MTEPAHRRAFAEAALKRVSLKGWRGVTLHELAALAGRPAVDFYPLTPADAFDCVDEYLDRAAAENAPPPEPEALSRDRVFDAVMRRFEAMEKQRPAVLAIDRAIERDAFAQAAAFSRAARTARWLLALAGADTDGVSAAARAQSLVFVLREARRAWAKDDAGDFAKTMAALDKGLRRADSFFEGVSKMAGGLRPGSPPWSARAGTKPEASGSP